MQKTKSLDTAKGMNAQPKNRVSALVTALATPGVSSTPDSPKPSSSPRPTAFPTSTIAPKPNIVLEVSEIVSEALSSPDGQYTAKAITTYYSTQAKYSLRLEVFGKNGKSIWLLFDDVFDFGPGYTTIKLLKWSNDSNALYFSDFMIPDGCGLFNGPMNVYKANLQSKTYFELVPATKMGITLSADDKKAAYVSDESLVIRDIATGQENAIRLLQKPTGYPIWSPNGSDIVIVQANRPCAEDMSFDIVKVSLQSGRYRVLIANDRKWLRPTEWLSQDELRMIDKDGIKWSFDPVTGKLKKQSH